MSETNITLRLKWNSGADSFEPTTLEDTAKGSVFLELIDDQQRWYYYYTEGASLIEKRTALRSARGIAKTGYVHPGTGVRHGVDFKLEEEVDQYKDLADDLKKSQRSWYGGHYKEFK